MNGVELEVSEDSSYRGGEEQSDDEASIDPFAEQAKRVQRFENDEEALLNDIMQGGNGRYHLQEEEEEGKKFLVDEVHDECMV